MAKFENPARGYIACPVCQSVSTVHQCGEGQLIETGEPPKNSRNLGLLYYRCPECGNSSISKRGSDFVSANMVIDPTELTPLEAAPLPADGIDATINNQTIALTESNDVSTIETNSGEASHTSASSTELTETQSEETPFAFPLKRVMVALAAILFLLWALHQLMPKPDKQQGGEHVAAG